VNQGISRRRLLQLLGLGGTAAAVAGLAACQLGSPTATTQSASKQVLLVAQENSADMELMLIQEVGVIVSMLEKAGYKVIVASAKGEPISAITGARPTLKPNLKLADAKAADYAGLVLPCMAANYLVVQAAGPQEAVDLAKQFVAQGKPVAAQVSGVLILGKSGVLNGKQYAAAPLVERVSGGIYQGNGVAQDGKIVTSGNCPYHAKYVYRDVPDGTPELTQKFIDLLAASS
jgi:putative intracellular protease/amidase